MIIRSRREKPTLFRRLFSRRSSKTIPDALLILSATEFQLELMKEGARSNRRTTGRDFSVIQMNAVSDTSLFANQAFEPLMLKYFERLRISDSIGRNESQLLILLPETNRAGGEFVANDLVDIARQYELELEYELLIYPEDDDVASNSDEQKIRIDSSELQAEIGEQVETPIQFSRDKTLASQALTSRPDLRIPFNQSSRTPIWKRTIDIVGSLAGLVLLSPVFVIAAIAIKLDSKGTIFFKQQREGLDGKHFGIWKFRTMCTDAESKQQFLLDESEQGGPAFKLKDDPRITTIGRYLRKSCIDELPQLINVLRGEMSLVGPRPLPVHESQACTVWQRNRLKVLPGLTCIWQVEGGREVDFDDWMRMDLEYLRKRSLWFDLKLIFKTAFVALLHRGSV